MSSEKKESRSFLSPLFVSPSDLIGSVLKNAGIHQYLEVSTLIDQWESIVGEQIAKNVQCLKIDKGILYLKVSHPAWKSEVHFQKEVLLTQIHQFLGKRFLVDIQVQ